MTERDLALVAIISLACGPGLPWLATPPAAEWCVPDPCRDGDRDIHLAVPTVMAAGYGVHSGSGYYAYGTGYYPSDKNTCEGWVVDVTQYPLSNSYWDGSAWKPQGIVIHSGPWDLPSSGPPYLKPGVKEDCNTYVLEQRFYRRKASESQFPCSPALSSVSKASWSDSGCNVEKAESLTSLLVSETTVFRVVTRVLLRGSAQQVGVSVVTPPPE